MKRVYEINDLTIDLGNIKNLRTEPFSSSSNGVYVIIELLNGKEYVQNPETEELELFEPQIKEGFGSIERAEFFMRSIREEWNKYLKYLDEKAYT
jgi:hypothetical protein